MQRHQAEIAAVHTWHLVLSERRLVIGQGAHDSTPPEIARGREGGLFHSQ
jgi:hypothetical protein